MTDRKENPPRKPGTLLVPFVAILFIAASLLVIWQVGDVLSPWLRLFPAKTVVEPSKDKH